MNANKQMVVSLTVRGRYGNVSDTTLARWLEDPRLNFPKPIIINRRRYWDLAELEAWERSRAPQREVA